MKHYRTLALKQLLAERATSLLILLAVVLSTMMTAVIGQSAGILSAMRQQQAVALCGDRYATFVQRTAEQVEKLRQDSRLSFVGTYITLGSAELTPSLSLGLNEYQEDVTAVYPSISRVKEGRLPESSMEIALPEDVLQSLGVTGKAGDMIHLSLSKALRHGVEIESYDYEANFILTGILESNYLGYAGGIVTGLVGAGSAKALLPERYVYYNADFCTVDKRTFQDTVNDLITRLNIHELDTIYNIPYLDALGVSYDTGDEYKTITGVNSVGFPLMLTAGVLVGVLLLLAAGLVIYNILKIAVSRRIKQYGALRAIGCEKGQLYELVVVQTLLLCAVGIPIGLLLGVLSSKGILTAATGLLSPDIFMVQSTEELNRLIAENSSGKGIFLLASAVITLLFAVAASIPAIRYAADVSPTVTIAGARIKMKRRNRKPKKIRCFEAYYARLNLKRSRARTAVTILSLVMSITVFIALQGSVSLLNTAGVAPNHLGDYSIVNETAGFPSEELATLENREDVSAVAAMQLSLYQTGENAMPVGIDVGFSLCPGETFQAVGLNETYLNVLFGESLSSEELIRLKAGKGCVIRNPLPLVFDGEEIPRTEIKAGETITVEGVEIPVFATLDGYDTYISIGNEGFINGVQVIVSPELYTRLTGKTEFHELKPILSPDANRDIFDQALETLTNRVPGSTWLSYEELDRQSAESFEQIRLLAWGLILFVGLIGLLNIINTVYTNIHTRITEIGMQRAIGMDIGSVYKTFLWEGIYISVIAAVIGGVAGYICTIFIEAAKTDVLQLTAVPVVPIVEATLLAITVCLIATCIPLGKIGKMSIVDSIETVE